MAQLPPGLLLANTKQGLSIYTMKGSDKIIVRKKGGASAKRIKTDPNFEMTRLYNSEFGGCAKAGSYVRRMLQPLKALADHNITGAINARMKLIQVLDTVSSLGKRNILLSTNPQLLEGFNVNRRTPFDTILQSPVRCVISKKKLNATVSIPAILPGVNFVVPGNFSLYQFIISLGIVPDLFYTTNGYRPKGKYEHIQFELAHTKWNPSQTGSPATKLTLQLPDKLPNESYSIILGIGIAFGTIRNGEPEAIRYAGGGKILGMA